MLGRKYLIFGKDGSPNKHVSVALTIVLKELVRQFSNNFLYNLEKIIKGLILM